MADRTNRPALGARDESALLVRAVWRRSRRSLVAVAVVVAAGLGMVIADIGFLHALGLDGRTLHDGKIRLTLLLATGALMAALRRGDPAFRSWLRRLPVDPARLLHARLQVALACAVVILVAVFLVEWIVAPGLLQPSFAERLNPIEVDTLERLPGVPLVRWQIDGEVREGLLGARSLAALRVVGPHAIGQLGGWDRRLEALADAKPGDRLALWTAEDWSRLDRWHTDRLRGAGVRPGAEIEATLVRYVPADEYAGGPWRRDGLLRPRSSGAIDRVIGFLGMVTVLVALGHAMGAESTRLARWIGVPVMVAIFFQVSFDPWWLRRLHATDVDRGSGVWRTTLPTLGPEIGPVERWLWPALVVVVAVAAVAFATRETRRAAYGAELAARRPAGSRRVRHPEVPLAAMILAVFVGIGIHGFRVDGYLSTVAETMPRLVCLAGAGLAAAILVARWSRHDAVLSRLPVDPARWTARRLAAFGVACVVFGVVLPTIFQEVPALRGSAAMSPSGGDGFTREDAFFLDRFGVVPVLVDADRGHRAPGSVPCWLGKSSSPRWESSAYEVPADGFLPRSRHFVSAFEGRYADLDLEVGTTFDSYTCRLRVTRLLRSRQEIADFLAEAAEPAARGPVPGSQRGAVALEVAACGALVLLVAAWCRARPLIWVLTPATIWCFLVAERVAWFRVMGIAQGVPPWWGSPAGVAAIGLLLVLAFGRLRRRIERGFR